MPTLTADQIAGYARAAGFTGDGLRWATAVALAESGGRTDAVGVNKDGSRDRGLWQINSRWHPEVSDAQAFDPAGAAKAAFAISAGGSNWKPWSTYGNGSAAVQLSRATTAVNAGWIPVPIPGSPFTLPIPDPGTAAGALGGLESLAHTLAAMASLAVHGAAWIGRPENWLRVVYVTAGAGAAITGLVLLSSSGVGGPVGAVGGTVVATGRKATRAAGTAAKAAVVL